MISYDTIFLTNVNHFYFYLKPHKVLKLTYSNLTLDSKLRIKDADVFALRFQCSFNKAFSEDNVAPKGDKKMQISLSAFYYQAVNSICESSLHSSTNIYTRVT